MNMTNLKDYATKGYKVRLYPNRKQKKLLFKYFKMSKFIYNLCIDIQKEYYETTGKFKDIEEEIGTSIDKRLSQYELDKKIKNLKYTDEYKWLLHYNAESIKGAIMDCCKAYAKCDNYITKNKEPKYKDNFSKLQFYSTPGRLTIMEDYVKLSSIGEIKYCNSYGDEILGTGNKARTRTNYLHFYNPRVSYDGLNFYLSFTILKDEKHQPSSYKYFLGNDEWKNQDYYNEQTCDSIGIDAGVKNEKWFVDSTGRVVQRPDSDKLRKRISRLQRKYQRQKDTNLKKNPNFFKYHPNGSKNMQKTLAKINKDKKKISNKRKDIVHNYACDLIKLKPKSIILESTFSNRMIESKYEYMKKGRNKINQMISDAALYESTMIIERKAINNGITVIRADSGYPSSQICSCCGYRQNIGRKEIYKCLNCGTIINRDLNAAINLANYEHIKDNYI